VGADSVASFLCLLIFPAFAPSVWIWTIRYGLYARSAGMQFAWLNRGGKAWELEAWVPHLTIATLAALCAQFTD